jgi:hypothetical protein
MITMLESNAEPIADTPPAARPAREKPSKSAPGVSRTIVNFWVDLGLLVMLGALVAMSVVVQFVFPTGTAADGWMLWGYSYNAWSRAQFGLTGVFLLGVLLHVMLHWSWVCGVVIGKLLRNKSQLAQQDDGTRTLYGVATLIFFLVAVGVFVAVAAMGIQGPEGIARP